MKEKKLLAIPPTRNHRQLAAWINSANLVTDDGIAVKAVVEPWTTSTDRKAGRLRIPGRGRKGLRLTITLVEDQKNYRMVACVLPHWPWFSTRAIYQQESGDPYARHEQARQWVIHNLRVRK